MIGASGLSRLMAIANSCPFWMRFDGIPEGFEKILFAFQHILVVVAAQQCSLREHLNL